MAGVLKYFAMPVIRISEEAYAWFTKKAAADGVSVGELIDAFSPNDWNLLDTYIQYAYLTKIIPLPTLAEWIRTASNCLGEIVKKEALKRSGFV